MGQIYDAIFEDIAVTLLQDLFEILAATDNTVYVHAWEIYQITDVGDAEEEILNLETVRGIGSTSSNGTAVTPHAKEDGFAAPGAVVERNGTTRMTGGTLEVLEKFGWNVRIPLMQIYTPETRPVITPGDRWTLSLPIGPSDSLTMSGKVTFEESGG